MRLSGSSLRILTCALVLAGTAAHAASTVADADHDLEAAQDIADRSAIDGPTKAPLVGHAHIELPAGKRFVAPGAAARLLRAEGYGLESGIVGMIVPKGASGWTAVVAYRPTGYIEEAQAVDWTGDAMLAVLRREQAALNLQRRENGFPEYTASSWLSPPIYDRNTHRLSWTARMTSPGGAVAWSRTVALCNDGYFTLDVLGRTADLAGVANLTNELGARFAFERGKAYEDFDPAHVKLASESLANLLGDVDFKRAPRVASVTSKTSGNGQAATALACVGCVLGAFLLLGLRKRLRFG